MKQLISMETIRREVREYLKRGAKSTDPTEVLSEGWYKNHREQAKRVGNKVGTDVWVDCFLVAAVGVAREEMIRVGIKPD